MVTGRPGRPWGRRAGKPNLRGFAPLRPEPRAPAVALFRGADADTEGGAGRRGTRGAAQGWVGSDPQLTPLDPCRPGVAALNRR